MKEIYADCASTTPISEPALRVMTECMRTCYGNPSSSHHCGREAARVLEEARDGIAACIGADREEIYFTSGGTEADNQAIFTAALCKRIFRRGSARCGSERLFVSEQSDTPVRFSDRTGVSFMQLEETQYSSSLKKKSSLEG